MKLRLTLAAALLAAPAAALAAGAAALYEYKPDIGNSASVQRGAAAFMNYCSGCHSLRFLRYGRLAEDHAIPVDLLQENLMFTSDKPGEHILSAMPADSAAQWFGQAPPDLTLSARARGADWIYSFLKSFYLDPSKANGVNNKQLPGASMPHVLGGLEGYKVVGHAEDGQDDAHHGGGHAPQWEQVEAGSLSAKEYDSFVSDLTNFLAYAAEPGAAKMHSRGLWVLFYLVFLLIPLTWLIKKEFWKDVH